MLEILYEDNHVIVAYKESGILSQADISNDKDILNMVKEYIKEKYNKPGAVYTGLVHRLDRNTSGLMVFAKTSKAASRLSEDIKKRNFTKCYLAVVEGVIEGNGTLKNKLKKNEKENKSYVSNDGLEAILNYEVLDNITFEKKNYSLVKIELLTGRHHQIRCQFAHIGHPLFGDAKYGAKTLVGNYFALSAYKLEFMHPTLKEVKSFTYFKENKGFELFAKGDNLLKKYDL